MRIYLDANDIASMLDVSKSKAYEVIRQLNSELKRDGYLVLAGKVPVAYFNKRWYGLENVQKELQGAL